MQKVFSCVSLEKNSLFSPTFWIVSALMTTSGGRSLEESMNLGLMTSSMFPVISTQGLTTSMMRFCVQRTRYRSSKVTK